MAHLAADQANEFSTGIPELDNRHVVPARKRVMVLLGATGMGKSWALIHLGRHALMHRKKILHVTLELSARDVQMRYLQNLLALPKYEFDKTATRSRLVVNNEGLLTGFTSEQVAATISLQSDPREVKTHLERFINHRPAQFANLRIKDFPARSLSVAALRGYLDCVDASGFVADIVLIDYAGQMQIDPENYRIAFGCLIEDLCGLASERNIAVVTAEQVSKEGAKAKQVDISHVAESWATVLPVDTVLSFTRTDKEKPHKLARLFVEKNRHGADGFGAVLAQNYQHGQFALQSAALPKLADYTDLLEDDAEDRS
jgi:replicative DNA helicase